MLKKPYAFEALERAIATVMASEAAEACSPYPDRGAALLCKLRLEGWMARP